MRLFKNSKFKLAITTGLSLLSVFVASISTAAWFQVNGNRTATVSNMDVSAGNGDVSIDKVTGYKHVYNELDASTIDYSSSHITSYAAKGVTTTSNINQGDVSEFDVPEEGVGYYIVGNAAWCEEQGKSPSAAWKYRGGAKMDNDSVYGNKAILANYHFTVGMEIRIRHHYFATATGGGVSRGDTLDEWSGTNCLIASSYAHQSGNNVIIDISGYYNVYYNSSSKISFYQLSADPVVTPSNLPTLSTGITRANNFSWGGGWIFLKVSNSNWRKDGARFALYWEYTDNTKGWYSMCEVDSTNHVYACGLKPPAANKEYNFIIFVRMKGSDDNNNWDNKWNETTHLAVQSGKNCCEITGDGWDYPICTWSNYSGSGKTYYLVGKINGTDAWSTTDHPLNLNSGLNVVVIDFKVGDKFKIRYGDTWECSWGFSDINSQEGSTFTDDVDGNAYCNYAGKYLITLTEGTFTISIKSVNYKLIVWDADQNGTQKHSYAMTWNSSSLSVACSNKYIESSYRFKIVNVPNNGSSSPNDYYYGYKSGKTTISASCTGYVVASTASDDCNFKVQYCGNYDASFNIFTQQRTIGVTSLTSPTALGSGNEITYYLEAASSQSSWYADSAKFAVFVYKGSGTSIKAKWFLMSKSPFTGGNVYSVTVDVQHDYLIFVRIDRSFNSSTDTLGWNWKWNQTGDITAPDTTGGINNYFIIDSNNGGNPAQYNGAWHNFYGTTDQGTGYYLVGTKAFTGSNEVEWSFTAGIKMTTGDYRSVNANFTYATTAYKENLTLRAGMEFKIWYYDATTGRGTEYATLASDDETRSIAYISSTNVKINAVEGNKFNIYLYTTNSIAIQDNDFGTYLFFNQNLSTYNKSVFKMGEGDNNTNDALYEGGLKITSTDITNGLSFVIRRKAHGAYSWYSYDNAGGTTAGLANHGLANNYSFIASQGSTSSYGDTTSSATKTGFKFTTADYYKFYLTHGAPDLVAISDLPDYGEGYYVMPYTNSTSTYTNGVKLRDFNTSSNNVAVYTCYSIAAGGKIYLRSYLNGIDRGVIPNLASDAETTSLASISDSVITFNHAGAYNIYVFKNNNYSTCQSDTHNYNKGLTISITEYSYSKFFTMNEIAVNTASGESTDTNYVKSCNSSMVLDIEFTTNNITSVASLFISKGGTGLSQYVGFSFAVDVSLGGSICYDYMRANHYSLDSTHTTLSNNTQLSAGTHHAYILIDYLPSAISSMPTTSIDNDFTFILNVNQINPVS